MNNSSIYFHGSGDTISDWEESKTFRLLWKLKLETTGGMLAKGWSWKIIACTGLSSENTRPTYMSTVLSICNDEHLVHMRNEWSISSGENKKAWRSNKLWLVLATNLTSKNTALGRPGRYGVGLSGNARTKNEMKPWEVIITFHSLRFAVHVLVTKKTNFKTL